MSATIAPPTNVAPSLMTSEEFLSLPDDKRDRILIRGTVWEKRMTYRNFFHSSVMAYLVYQLTHWAVSNPDRGLNVVSGEAGVRLRTDPATIVGIDVAVVRRQATLLTVGNRTILDEPPLLAAEILSPSDRQREVEARVDEYLATGVPLVWIVSPHFRTITAHAPGKDPQMFSGNADLIAEPVLPGFRIPVARVFETI
ncbi:MAG: Uma2 family endonuclease [Planctomycetaceae bacterium]|nr:Uma2 family endonuclease [Planctomycetaceae bacterium]